MIDSVDDKGVITAVNNGNTSIIITNDDYTMSVNVIVNTDGKAGSDKAVNNGTGNQDTGVSDSVAEKIRNSSEETVTVSGVKTITSEALRALCGTDSDDLRKLNSVSGKNIFSISSAGEYIISESKAEHFRINIIWVIGAAGVILAMTVIYIFTMRKYWFW